MYDFRGGKEERRARLDELVQRRVHRARVNKSVVLGESQHKEHKDLTLPSLTPKGAA